MDKFKARLFNKIIPEPNSGCWLWLGAHSSNDYGTVRDRSGKVSNAHRVVYVEEVGAIPDGLVLDHTCRNPACVNPDHLESVSFAENLRRDRGAEVSRKRMLGNTLWKRRGVM